MAIHPSLNFSEKDKKQRSVLKRIERIKHMIEKNEWKEGDAIFGLPKIKSVRIKIKKEKIEKAADAAAAGAASPEAGKEAVKPAAKTEKK
ncbi:MAG: small basic protein [Candidatus Omnitrophica bacterium]|nr:small basic protein [Candidatus Omnitrophota bacterium]